MGEKWGTFENLRMWKHKTNLKFVHVLAYVKCTYLLSKYWLGPLIGYLSW